MTTHSIFKALHLKHLIYLFAFILIISPVIGQEEEIDQDIDYSYEYDKFIRFHWKGALTSHSVTFKVFPYLQALSNSSFNTYLACYTRPAVVNSAEDQEDGIIGYNDVNISLITFDTSDYPVGTVVLENLNPNTFYHYSFFFTTEADITANTFQSDYESDEAQEHNFTTLGIALTAYNFTFGASCCAQTNSTSPVFSKLLDQELDFFVHMGDMHYEDISENNTAKFFNAYYHVFSAVNQRRFLQNIPIFYVWDDDDFGSSDANGKSPTRYAATYAYDKFVPHKSFKAQFPEDDGTFFPGGEAPQANNDRTGYKIYESSAEIYGIYQSFIVGRCLFIIMDLRSFKDIEANNILGTEQTKWLENQLRFASVNPLIKQVFLVSSIPWLHKTSKTEWADYNSTQTLISGWVKQYITDVHKKLIMLSGHTHMVAFDDGTNNPYGGFTVIQAGALDQNPSCEGGSYSHGLYTGREQYAVFDVVDYDNDTVCVKVSLERQGDPLIYFDTCHPEKSPKAEASCLSIVNSDSSVVGGSTSYFVIILIAIGIIAIIVFLVMKYRSSNTETEVEGGQEKDMKNYMELTDRGKKTRKSITIRFVIIFTYKTY